MNFFKKTKEIQCDFCDKIATIKQNVHNKTVKCCINCSQKDEKSDEFIAKQIINCDDILNGVHVKQMNQSNNIKNDKIQNESIKVISNDSKLNNNNDQSMSQSRKLSQSTSFCNQSTIFSEIDRIKLQIEQEQLDFQQQELEIIEEIKDEKEICQQFQQELEIITANYENQVVTIRDNLVHTKSENEKKVQNMESQIQEGQKIILSLKSQLDNNESTDEIDPEELQKVKDLIQSKNNKIMLIESGFQQAKDKYEKKQQQIISVLESKDKIIKDLSYSNQSKEAELQKMEEIITNFKQLLEYYNQEKVQIEAENQKLSEEIVNFIYKKQKMKEFLSKLMVQNENQQIEENDNENQEPEIKEIKEADDKH